MTDEVLVSEIWESRTPIRCGDRDIDRLAASIRNIGLLHPIVIRFKEDHYEIVAGSRRYAACKLLRWRKIPCNIVDLDDKTSFEVSLVENIQRRTMDPLEEAEAFQKYVAKYGWGSASQLATKLGKSSSYISKRLALLTLPSNVIEMIRAGDLGSSVAEELLGLDAQEDQSELALLVASRRLSLRKVRDLVHKGSEYDQTDDPAKSPFGDSCPDQSTSERALTRATIAIRISLNRLASIMEDVENDWVVYEELMVHKNVLHSEIDRLLRERSKLPHARMISSCS